MLNRSLKRVLIYLAITIACGIFSFIYEQHSHQVYSNYMVYLFMVPLILGVIPQLVFTLLPWLDIGGSWQRIIHNFAIATLSVATLLRGMLEIYGTTSAYIGLYFVAGASLLITSVALWLTTLFGSTKSIRRSA